MADARSKAVLDEYLDQLSRRNYVFNTITDLSGKFGKGDSIELPLQAAPTNSSSTVATDGESLAPTVESTMLMDQEINYNVYIPPRDEDQLLDGNWAKNLGKTFVDASLARLDSNLLTYLATSLAWDTAGTYHTNPADGDLAASDYGAAKAAMLAQDGVYLENLLWIFSSFGSGAVENNIPSAVPVFAGLSASGQIGLPVVASVGGIPVITSNGIVRNRAIATTAAVTTGSGVTHTYDVAAGHGLVPGMLVTVTGHDAHENISTPTAITGVTATQIVVQTAATTDGTSTLTAGTITSQTSMNLLIDRSAVFGAMQRMPKIEAVKSARLPGFNMQLYCSFARGGYAGRARVLHTRGSAL